MFITEQELLLKTVQLFVNIFTDHIESKYDAV